MMLERVEIPAREIRAGDRIADYSGAPVGVVTDTEEAAAAVSVAGEYAGTVEAVEVWTDLSLDPMGMPCLTVAASDPVTVWREVSR